MTFVTIILTTLNSERYLARSIESCLGQTHKDFELLIVDGGSHDCTLEVVAGYQQQDPRIRVVHQVDNIGKLPGAINLGLENGKGEFITWTQDDSWFHRDAIATMVCYLESNPDTALVYTDYIIIDSVGKGNKYEYVKTPEYENMLQGDVIGQSFLFRRVVYDVIGPQRTQHFPVHEIPWRIEVAKRFRIDPLHIPLVYYSRHPGSLTGRIGGWMLLRLMAGVLFTEGYIDSRTLRKRNAKIDIDQAYEQFQFHGDYSAFRSYALSGIQKDWSWLRNIGFLKLFVFSFIPNIRTRYRKALFSQWRTCNDKQQSQFLQQ